MENKSIGQSLWRLSLLTLAAAAVFLVFFQTAKNGPFRAVNPFLDDPVDAIGSIAIQVGLLGGLLTLARGLRIRSEPERLLPRRRWIINGAGLVLFAISVTVLADAVMEFQHPTWEVNRWGGVLAIGLVVMFGLAVLLGVFFVRVLISSRAGEAASVPDEQGSLAGALEDLWRLVKAILDWVMHYLRFFRRPLTWLEHIGDRFFAWLLATPVSPERHPWRFVLVAGILIGILLVLAGLQEGLPPSPGIFLLLLAIFVSVETGAVLLGFLMFGGMLGLRPPLLEPSS